MLPMLDLYRGLTVLLYYSTTHVSERLRGTYKYWVQAGYSNRLDSRIALRIENSKFLNGILSRNSFSS